MTLDRMKTVYGKLFKKHSIVALDEDKVPRHLWPLLPYAAFWGIEDDRDREARVREADKAILEDLVAVVRMFDDYLDFWLAGPEASSPKPSSEYIAFSAMRMAADFV